MLFCFSPQKESRLNNIIEGIKIKKKKDEGDEKENQESPAILDDVAANQPIRDENENEAGEDKMEEDNGESNCR